MAAEAAQALVDWMTAKGWPLPAERIETVKGLTGGLPTDPSSGWPVVHFQVWRGPETLYCGFALRSHKLADIDVTAFDEVLIANGLVV